jgi:hypothetical protein
LCTIPYYPAGFPEQLLSQMATCQTAANEFLRQFWFSLFYSPQEMRNPAFARFIEQREAKASKMVSYLRSTQEKVEALYLLAQQLNVDATIVETVCFYKYPRLQMQRSDYLGYATTYVSGSPCLEIPQKSKVELRPESKKAITMSYRDESQ